ncbi:hypothetical protein [Micromonospora sp. NPDC049662]|uniref:hypothetical protein n=1 Tax=Micromonospora sp. NPDC049662 TaxID=3155397 RepID=UPI003436E057
MNLDRGSILNFAPADPDLWEVEFVDREDDRWTLPVIGHAVVVTHAAKDAGDLADTGVYPVVEDDGTHSSIIEYLNNWELKDRPRWRILRKPRTRQAACPACGLEATYAADPDRYFHNDGSDNRPCWLRLVRGEATA